MNAKRTLLAASILSVYSGISSADIIVGTDLNSSAGNNDIINEFYAGNRGTNGGGDQSLQFGDQLYGTRYADVIIGGLGIDILFGNAGDDVLIGGTEDFNSANRDRAFGNDGDDVFIWAPGDGNDFFDGGAGTDVLILGLVGESQDDDGSTEGAPFFNVTPPSEAGSKNFDGIYINPTTYLPVVDVVNGPGFCEVLDDATTGLSELNLDHLVRFTLKGPADVFDETLALEPSIDPNTLDTGLRVAVHLTNTEFVVCASREGGDIDVFDLRNSPITKTTTDYLPASAYALFQVQ
ncbi:hypothetical protein A9Q99_22850 [Gammaproteobacteria bacterium 45_16_T64]|nr:hypothetical protein A9Q99_22850 [Gammaproteobacteria bacterium 45_16_T64]